ncbi:MAG: lipopolysaccharide biosynthesis protein [Acidiferrobacteraceae bacterium]
MKLREIYRYTGLLYGANIATSFITFLVTVLITRHISRSEFGMYGLFQAYFLLFAYTAGLGVSQTTVQFVAGRRLPLAQLHSLVGAALALISVSCIAGALLLLYLGNRLAGLALFGVPAYQLYEAALSYARGKVKRHREAGILILSSSLTSVFIVIMTLHYRDDRGPIYGQLCGLYTTAILLLAGFFLGRPHRFAAVRLAAVKKFNRIAGPVYVSAALFAIAESFDRFVVHRYLGFSVVGEYVFALTFLNIVNKPISLLSRVLLSHFSMAEVPGDPGTEHAAFEDIIRLNLFLIPTFALVVSGALPSALGLFLTRNYSLSFSLFAVISIIVVLKSVELVNSSLLIAKRTPMTNVYTQILTVVVYVPLALLLARKFGVFGVAGAVVLRWSVMSAAQVVQMRRLGMPTGASLLARSLVAYAASLLLFRSAPWLMFPLYLGLGFALQLWTVKDVERVLAMARPPRLLGKP